MLHDIHPKVFHNSFERDSVPDDKSYIVFTEGNSIYLKTDGDVLSFPQFVDYSVDKYVFLFRIDNRKFYLGSGDTAGLQLFTARELRKYEPLWISFAAAVAVHIKNWYEDNIYCGRCGSILEHKEDERALICSCGNIVYPRINPVVIAAVINDGKILAVRYNRNHSAYRNYALVAGFIEIGETLEEGCIREIYEETGLKVKDIRYFKSQPWPYSQSLIAGFFCSLDGNDEICLEQEELAEAVWLKPEEIPDLSDNRSLTAEMFTEFKENSGKWI